jgi:hypothetical protein
MGIVAAIMEMIALTTLFWIVRWTGILILLNIIAIARFAITV